MLSNQVIISTLPTFSWISVEGAKRYTLIVKHKGQIKLRLKLKARKIYADGICTVDALSTPKLNRLKNGKRYTWRVKTDTFTVSPKWSFTVATYAEKLTPSPWAMHFITDNTNSLPWSTADRNEVSLARHAVGNAFRRRSHFPTDTVAEAFNRVMVNGDNAPYILMVRTNITVAEGGTGVIFTDPVTQITYPPYMIFGRECRAFNSFPAANRAKVVICNGIPTNYPFNQYTYVHEFGHLFDYSSGFVLRDRVGSTQTLPINNCIGQFVMGVDPENSDWQRGPNGWGSGPARRPNGNRLVTNFQQNSDNNYGEAAADMFLNWVYRSNTANGLGATSCANQGNPGHWAGPGFLNELQPNSSTVPLIGLPDLNLSGDRRHRWMDRQVIDIFSQHPSW